MIYGAFVTGSGTGVGKTFVTRGIARAFARRGLRCAALKPIETGVTPDPLDALALAKACGRPDLAHLADFYRAAPPLAPYAAFLDSSVPLPNLTSIVERIRAIAAACDALWVEGAGGLLVPLDAHSSMADLAIQLRLPLLLVASDQLGVLSHVLTCHESAQRRGLRVAATVLVSGGPDASDASSLTNRSILSERLAHPVLVFPRSMDDDDALADAAQACGLLTLLEEDHVATR